MIDVKIEKTEILRKSNKGESEGLEISYRLNNSKQWNTIELTKAESSKLGLELLKAVLNDIYK